MSFITLSDAMIDQNKMLESYREKKNRFRDGSDECNKSGRGIDQSNLYFDY